MGKITIQLVRVCIKIRLKLTLNTAFVQKCKYFFPVINYHIIIGTIYLYCLVIVISVRVGYCNFIVSSVSIVSNISIVSNVIIVNNVSIVYYMGVPIRKK